MNAERPPFMMKIRKNFDSGGAFGSCFMSAQCLPEGASGLRLETRLNGRTVQDANTSDMIFNVQTLIATCLINAKN
jgi:2-keto-4-pentenoate hydratase/2-oxohepta-3-ene-1,7-dioic acid hydratase in catechol pathway